MSRREATEDERKKLLQSYQRRIEERDKTIANPADEKDDQKGTTLVVAFVLMLVFQLGNRIFGRLQTYPMHNYPLFLNMLMIVIYIPICFAYVIPVIAMGSNRITREQMEIPKYKFAVMGAYDSIAGIMQTFAVNYITNASLIVLVQQSAIPISMVISRYALKSTYTQAQYIGAAVVLMGIVVVLIPNFFSTPATASTVTDTTAGPDPTTQLIWLLVLVVSCVPMCLSSVYKEKALGETEIDIMYLNGWVAVFQFLIAIPLCLPTSLIQNIPLSEIMPNMYGGMRCWMGYNSITAEHNPQNLPLDDCSTAPVFVTVYLFFNVIYNFLIVIILKLGSANILWMASTVIVPLSNVAFSLHFMPGHQPLRTWDILGLVVIMVGLVIYRFSKDLLSFVRRSAGYADEEETDVRLTAAKRRVAQRAEEKQLRYVGINQVEYLQSMVESRVEQEQSLLLFRSPSQVRGDYLARLGISPSPHITMSGPGRRPTVNTEHPSYQQAQGGSSPMVMLTPSQRRTSFRATSGYVSAPSGNTATVLSSSYRTPGIMMANLSSSNSQGGGVAAASPGKPPLGKQLKRGESIAEV